MSVTSPGPHNPTGWQRTNLTEFCQQLRQHHSHRLARHRVTVNFHVASDLACDLPHDQVRAILDAWITEALDEMPAGGELDVSVVLCGTGLEIEVADSRDTDIHETRDFWHRQLQIAGHTEAALADQTLQVETAFCPQGGLARTVIIPQSATSTAAEPTARWRKVA